MEIWGKGRIFGEYSGCSDVEGGRKKFVSFLYFFYKVLNGVVILVFEWFF